MFQEWEIDVIIIFKSKGYSLEKIVNKLLKVYFKGQRCMPVNKRLMLIVLTYLDSSVEREPFRLAEADMVVDRVGGIQPVVAGTRAAHYDK